MSAVRFIARGATDEGSAALRERILRAVAGHPAADVIALGDSFIPKLAASVLPEARLALDHHAALGQDRIIVSASPIEIVGAIADALGLEGAVGTRSEIVDGCYTGKLEGPFCYREGKVTEITRLAAERGYDLDLCSAYSDSISDLPFLQAVGNPVAINADRELLAHAAAHGWQSIAVAKASLRSRPRVATA